MPWLRSIALLLRPSPFALRLTPFTLCLLLIACTTTSPIKDTESVNTFIGQMATKHGFDESELDDLFKTVEIKQDILKRIASPSEGLPWYKYRKIFLTEARIDAGVQFWRDNAPALAAAEKQYGVPAEIIVAIIGVETLFGKNTGNHRVIDALSTLAFAYPPRSKFFLSELENFLLLCRDEHINPIDPTGSYAGAMGLPQFMPSSFRTYAVDFDNDDRRDIWHNNSDAIASVANYFAKHHWHTGKAIAVPVTAKYKNYEPLLKNDLKPDLSLTELESLNLIISRQLPFDSKVKLLSFEQQQGEELWAALDNFYVITRYNHSPLYAMAVYQLSLSILNKKGSFP
ncbi:lytic murein transglycosylase B [Methylobacter sp.]|uniref:lytic murein transglycosylase B n=1 Tax=Methylobacter sp. TaxID=2051955 RepID=UPI0012238A7B|nr:lytic murein transglycosylase B [Methylobacter sp.]TAK60397.1 MAG: lytic murein transglycosylase B [Methylobacter sp.]